MLRDGLRAVLIDLNGTVHIGTKELPNSITALQRLRTTGAKIRFVSNTSKDTTESLVSQVQDIGFDITAEEVWTTIGATRKVVKLRGLRPYLLLQPQAAQEFAGLPCQPPYNAVVVGLARDHFSYENMNQAFKVLLDNPTAPLLAMHKGRFFKDPSGALLLGPGPFVEALEYATDRKAEVLGKPSAAFFHLALDGVLPSEAVMIGDDCRDDVGGAQEAGMKGILVQTGKYREGDEHTYGIQPDATVPDFAAAVQWLMNGS